MISWLRRHITELRFPWLLGCTLLLLAVDLAVPDVVPFADELLLAAIAALLARLKRRPEKKDPGKEPGSEQQESR